MLTHDELLEVVKMIEHLDECCGPENSSLSFDCYVIDSNGEELGKIAYESSVSGHTFTAAENKPHLHAV